MLNTETSSLSHQLKHEKHDASEHLRASGNRQTWQQSTDVNCDGEDNLVGSSNPICSLGRRHRHETVSKYTDHCTLLEQSQQPILGRVAQLAQRMAVRTCAMRYLLIGPKKPSSLDLQSVAGNRVVIPFRRAKLSPPLLHVVWKDLKMAPGRSSRHNKLCASIVLWGHGEMKQ